MDLKDSVQRSLQKPASKNPTDLHRFAKIENLGGLFTGESESGYNSYAGVTVAAEQELADPKTGGQSLHFSSNTTQKRPLFVFFLSGFVESFSKFSPLNQMVPPSLFEMFHVW